MTTFVGSMLGPTLSESQAGAFRQYAQWRVVNERMALAGVEESA